jgi:hypothetical protein
MKRNAIMIAIRKVRSFEEYSRFGIKGAINKNISVRAVNPVMPTIIYSNNLDFRMLSVWIGGESLNWLYKRPGDFLKVSSRLAMVFSLN